MTKATPKAKPNNGRKLSFKDKHALETLPGRMDDLQAEIHDLEQSLADPTFYGRDPSAFDAASARLTTVRGKLSRAEEDWLTLEMRREELDGGGS